MDCNFAVPRLKHWAWFPHSLAWQLQETGGPFRAVTEALWTSDQGVSGQSHVLSCPFPLLPRQGSESNQATRDALSMRFCHPKVLVIPRHQCSIFFFFSFKSNQIKYFILKPFLDKRP